MAAASGRHHRIVREQVEASGGHVFKTVGEAHRAVFADPVAALSSAVAIQRAVGAEPWTSSLPIRVCMALHSGACAERDGDYVGPVVNRTARLLDIGHGGQVLVTAAPGQWTQAEVSQFTAAGGSAGSDSENSCIIGYFERDMSFGNAMAIAAVESAAPGASLSPTRVKTALVSKYGTAEGDAISAQFGQVLSDSVNNCGD
jgi:hypothetical protein